MAPPDAAIRIAYTDDETATSFCVVPGQPPREGDLHTVSTGGLPALPAPQSDATESFIVFPRHEATLRILEVPSQDPDEIDAMVRLGAADMVPYPIAEMAVVYQPIARLPSGESRVAVVLVRHSAIARYTEVLQRIPGQPRGILLSTACLVAAARSIAPAGEVALLEVTPRALELVIARDGALRFSRALERDTPWDTETPAGLAAMADEVNDLLAAYRRESLDGAGVDSLHVSVLGLSGDHLVQALENSTGKACTEVNFAQAPPSCPAVLFGAMQLVQGGAPVPLDLTPESVRRTRSAETFRKQSRHLFKIAVVIVLSLSVWFGQALWQRKQLIHDLRQRIQRIAPSAEGVAAKQRGLQIITHQVDRGPSLLEILAVLVKTAPEEGLNITRLQYDRDSGVNIWGRARSKDLVLKDYLGAMRAEASGDLALLSRAHSLYETDGTERGQPVVNYQITIPSSKENDEDPGAPTR